MAFEPFSWNVVVVGAWNRAILTPEWIGRYVFQLEDGTPVSLEVPVNVTGPWRVRHESVSALVGQGNFEVATVTPTYEALERARECAKRAMHELPRTPLAAAGFNIRFRSPETPPELATALSCELDNALSAEGFEINRRRAYRSLALDRGMLNLEITLDPTEGSAIQLNFHMGSTSVEDLGHWLSIPIETVQEKTNSIIRLLPGVMHD